MNATKLMKSFKQEPMRSEIAFWPVSLLPLLLSTWTVTTKVCPNMILVNTNRDQNANNAKILAICRQNMHSYSDN